MSQSNQPDSLGKAGAVVNMVYSAASCLVIIPLFIFVLFMINNRIAIIVVLVLMLLILTVVSLSFLFNYNYYKKGNSYRTLAIIFGIFGSTYLGSLLIFISLISEKQEKTTPLQIAKEDELDKVE